MPAPHRHYLLYARQTLRDFRTILGIFVLLYLAIGIYDAYSHHQAGRVVQWAVSASFPLIIGGLIFLYSRRTFVEFQERGVLIRQFMRAAVIPYTDIEKVRLDTMEHIFDRPDRKRWQSKTVRGLYKERVLCLKVRADEQQTEELRRRLGGRTFVEREVVLPLTETDAAMGTVKQRLAARRQGPVAETAETARRRRRGKRGR